MSDPVATKYYACTQFDQQGQCVAAVWVDQPSILPPLTVAQGGQIGMAMFAGICVVYISRRLFSEAK